MNSQLKHAVAFLESEEKHRAILFIDTVYYIYTGLKQKNPELSKEELIKLFLKVEYNLNNNENITIHNITELKEGTILKVEFYVTQERTIIRDNVDKYTKYINEVE